MNRKLYFLICLFPVYQINGQGFSNSQNLPNTNICRPYVGMLWDGTLQDLPIRKWMDRVIRLPTLVETVVSFNMEMSVFAFTDLRNVTPGKPLTSRHQQTCRVVSSSTDQLEFRKNYQQKNVFPVITRVL